MLKTIDRVQLAVPDRRAAAEGWVALLGAEPSGEDRVAALAALEERARERGAGFTPVPGPDPRGPEGPQTIFLHPPAQSRTGHKTARERGASHG